MGSEIDKLRREEKGALAPRESGSLTDPLDLASPWSPPKGLFTFRYSSTEIFTEGSNLHVRMRETRFEDGRLKSEECEGTLDRQAYNQVMNEAQGFFLNQVANFTRLMFAPLLSSSSKRRHDE
ncbi:hypothetical protein [Noviherbaspirillum sp. ST9]|uniref:hypothetical protein n=1 Tax=Noviherbaspirillum sp. ST9 TaxID=3401606 RepID=UPI003B586E3E